MNYTSFPSNGSIANNTGLSTVHNSPEVESYARIGIEKPAVRFWLNGNLVESSRYKIPGVGAGPGGRRGKAAFSAASRRRLMKTLAKTDKTYIPLFVTLTYPAEFPNDARRWKRDLDTFFKRLVRRFPRAAGVWKLEPQRRGAPHYHLLVWGCTYKELIEFTARAWYQVVGSGDEKHYRAGTRVEKIKSRRGVFSYASKYMGKVNKSNELSELWSEGVGRYWGVFARENVPWASLVVCECSDRAAVLVIRYLRRFGHIRGLAFRSLSVICDGDFWFDKLRLDDE